MKKLLILLLTLVFTSATFAEKVTEQQALQKAQKFFKDKRIESKNLSRGSKTELDPNATREDFYVFNAENKGGFVIISGDDRTPEVLGYADSGSLDMENLPPNLKGWLEEYSRQMKALETIGITGERTFSRAQEQNLKAAIEPLITAQWGQESPYNYQCPEIDGKRCVTGCIATAMAQVMYYHKWPQEACTAIPKYTSSVGQNEMPELPPTTFKWEAMRDRYWEGEHGESADAVAELMRYCGQAAIMQYGIYESYGYIRPYHFINYFGYGKNAKYITMSQYSMSQWEDILYDELCEGRPMLYCGYDFNNNGHEFICDGYDGDGYYHFNWGWDGGANGFFLLSTLCYEEGLFYGYVGRQDAIIGLQPDKDEKAIPYINGYNEGDLVETEYVRSSESEDFTEISLTEGIVIRYEIVEDQDVSIEYGLGLYKDTQLLTVLDQATAVLNLNNYTVFKQANVAFGKNLEDGVYQIRSIYRLANNDNWEACADAYVNYIVAEISSNNLNLRKICKTDTENATYTVNNVSIIGNVVTVNLTNTGNTNQEMLAFFFPEEINGYKYNCFMAYVCADIKPGETGDVVFPVRSTAGFDQPFFIAADTNCERVMWEGTISSPERVEQYLTCSDLSIANCKNGVLMDSEAHITLTITNSGDKFYKDLIFCNRITQPISLNVGETKNIEFVISHLEDNKNYNLGFGYYGKEGSCYFESNSSLSFLVAKNSVEYEGLKYSYNPDSKTASVIPGDYNKLESVTIPTIINVEGISYSVTEIASNTFKGCHFQSVSLPEGLLAIGGDAFMSCDIKSIALPSTLKSIGGTAFYNSKLTEITIPEGVVAIGYAALRDSWDLEVLRLPSTLFSIDYDVIFCCNNLKSVYSAIPDPQKVADNTFALGYDEQGMPVPPSATLYVPKGSVSKYQETAGWNLFTRITDKLPYKLTYYVDGEIYESYMIEEETSITAEAAPTKEGYTFSGWSEIPEVMPDHDVTVTGSFTPINYAITYELNGGDLAEGATNPPTYTIESETFTLNNPIRDGYTFAGWTGTGLSETSAVVTINKGSTHARAYTANWKKLLTNGITVESIADQVYMGGSIEPTVIVKDDETAITNDCNIVFTDNINVGTATITITAKTTSTAYDGEISTTFKIIPKTAGLSWSETTTFDCDDTEKTITAIATGLEGLDICNVTLSGNKATEVGKYTATVTALDNANYQLPATGLTCNYEIVRKMENLFNGSSYWTGYVAQEDLELPIGLAAYTVTSLGTEKAIATSLDYIPKDEPVLLTRTDTEVNLYRASAGTGTASNDNMLQIASATNQPTAFRDYVLYKDAFVLVNGGVLADGKVFLRVPQDNLSRASIYPIAINGDNATIIKSLFDDQYPDLYDQWYTIEGRKLDGKPTRKGLYIHNGKKEVVK